MTTSGRRRRVTVIQEECLEDLRYWVDTGRKTALRVLDLMEAVMRGPYAGLGKPEHLKHLGGNVWSRRINEADRLVYEVFTDRIEFLQARYHYG
ncbi:MAG TPA: Txe/YoeB family addiction module toxin [Gemmatimonadales bacterium]|nr:Txe/YoeB family addiction module toxin [Gemmatimonadales bacterium]